MQVEQIEKSHTKSKKKIPKGCFEPDQLALYIQIKDYLLIKDMYNIVCPFRYNQMSYVVVRKKDKLEGEVLQLFHQVSKRSLLRAVPKTGQIGCKYQIYCTSTDRIVARVRGDLMSNKFFVFDGGNNPSKKKFPSRKELAYIYTSNGQFFSQKPSTLTAILANHTKRMPDDDEIETLGTLYEADGILQIDQATSQLLKADKENSKRVFSINSVQPMYCPYKKGYVMDLKGLISQPSPVNMVMKTSNNQDCIVMGKRSENTYLLHVGSPLTLVQAFGVFVSNFICKKE